MSDDWMQRLRATTDRLYQEADAPPITPRITPQITPPNPPPPTVKRKPYTTPSGATHRAQRAQNAATRIHKKKRPR
jgi:hypothetical protein